MTSTIKKYSFWWEHAPSDFKPQSQLPEYADAVIIGAGFAGVSTAYWLARLGRSANNKAGLRIVILDEAPHAAFKASGRIDGSVYLGDRRSAKYVACLMGKKTAKQLYHYSAQNNRLLEALICKGIHCNAEFNGGLRMASTTKEVKELNDSAALLREWGHYPVCFDTDQSAHLLVGPHAKRTLFVAGEGYLDPFVFINKLTRVLRRNGITIAYGARVDYTESSQDAEPRLYLSNGHMITAGNIIHTTQYALPEDDIEDKLKFCREQVIRIRAWDNALGEMPLPLMPIGLSCGLDVVHPCGKSVIATGGTAGLKRNPELNILDDSGFNKRVFDNLDKTLMYHLPTTNHAEITHAWTYIDISACDGLPLMGAIPGMDGHYINMAHGHNRLGLAFLGAKNVAEQALHKKVTDPEFAIFSPQRFTQLG